MRDAMLKNMRILMICSVMIFVESACSTPAEIATSLPLNTSISMGIPTPAPTYSPVPTPIRQPTDTLVPATTPTTFAACFVTFYDPIAFTPDNNRILVKSNSGIQVFNLQTMKEEKFIGAPPNFKGLAAALSPDGETLAWALEDNTIQLLRVSDLALLSTIRTGHTGMIKLKFTPKGDRLFSASHDGWVKEWDRDGKQVTAFQPGGGEVMNIGLSQNGKMLATIPSDGPVMLWNLDDYKLIRELRGSGGYDTSDVAFSPDGQFVAADLATGLFLWKVSDGTELMGGNSAVNSMAVAFSPDGHIFAYSDINDVVLSSPDGTQKINRLEGHQAPVFKLVFSPDGSMLASVDDTEILIWQVEDGKLLDIGKSKCP
jgi:WD40 repeat protein